MANNYDINYEDERFKDVEADREKALAEVEDTYSGMIDDSDGYFQSQIDASKEWADQQAQLQQQNTDFAIEQIEQQKDQAEKDYTREQSGAYTDWQKQSNAYGVNAEQMASGGLTNTGFSESSQVSMYNTYQNRVAVARESFNQIVMNYNNNIKEAQLQNNSKLAEIYFNAQQQQLELALQGFQYKNQLIETQANKKLEVDQMYYNRYQDVLNQMNTENALAEEIRQYNESIALQREQLAEEIRQYEQSYALQLKEYEESIRQFDEEIARLKAKDKADAEAEAKQLELQKKQLEQEQAQWEQEYQLKKSQLAEQQRQYNESAKITKNNNSSDNTINENNTMGNSKETMAREDYYFDNGYQPGYVNNAKLAPSGATVGDVFGTKFGTKMSGQNIWHASDGKFYFWDGSSGNYIDVTSEAKKVFNSSVNNKIKYTLIGKDTRNETR